MLAIVSVLVFPTLIAPTKRLSPPLTSPPARLTLAQDQRQQVVRPRNVQTEGHRGFGV
jgi:hypothetical protein